MKFTIFNYYICQQRLFFKCQGANVSKGYFTPFISFYVFTPADEKSFTCEKSSIKQMLMCM